MSIDTSALERYLDLLEAGGDQIDREAAIELARTVDALATYAQSIAHRKSGFMADSMHQLGPFALGGGILESQIASLAPYTIFVLARGGDADWANRTLLEQAAVLDALQERLGRIVAAATGAGA
jgi:hypothetical protein